METIKTVPALSFQDALKSACSRMFQFSGRARRSEYWWTMLAVVIIVFVLALLTAGLGEWGEILSSCVACVLSLLMIPLNFRRLHDVGRSGWWWGGYMILSWGVTIWMIVDLLGAMVAVSDGDAGLGALAVAGFGKYVLLSVVLFVYAVVLLVFTCLDSKPGRNKYGDSPKYVPEG